MDFFYDTMKGTVNLMKGSKMQVHDDGACGVCGARMKEDGGFKDLSMHSNVIPI